MGKEVQRRGGEVDSVCLGVVDASNIVAVTALARLAVAVGGEVLDVLGLAGNERLLLREVVR